MYVSANSGTMREAIVAFTISQKDGPRRTYIIGGEAGIIETGTVGSTGSVLTRARGGLNIDDRYWYLKIGHSGGEKSLERTLQRRG